MSHVFARTEVRHLMKSSGVRVLAEYAAELGAPVCGARLRDAKLEWHREDKARQFCTNLANITNPDGSFACPYHSQAFREHQRQSSLALHASRPRKKRIERCRARRSLGYAIMGRRQYVSCTRRRGHRGSHTSYETRWEAR